MEIAVIDDAFSDVQDLSECLKIYMLENGISYNLNVFTNAESFFQSFSPGAFQIVFMDIYMPGMNGIEAAKKLRRTDNSCKLIFTTFTENFARMGYGLSAVHYLIKPISKYKSDFEEAMRLCCLKPDFDVPAITVISERQKFDIATENIMYIEYSGRITHIHTVTHQFPVSGSFSDVTFALKRDRRFLNCYRGIIVNMDYIAEIGKQNFILINNDEIPITLRNIKHMREEYRKYIFAKMGSIR